LIEHTTAGFHFYQDARVNLGLTWAAQIEEAEREEDFY
jgi:hypothetical protein